MLYRKIVILGMIGILAAALFAGCGKKDEVAEDVDTESTESAGANFEDVEYGSTNFSADLTHDGSEEVVTVTVAEPTGDQTVPEVTLAVSSGSQQIFSEDVIVGSYSLGDSYYLVYIDGEAYLMRYKPLYDHDEATDEYEIFSLDSSGDKQQYAVGSIEVSCYNIADIDSSAWISFATMVDQYRSDAKLLVSTLEGGLECGSPDSNDYYIENFDWLVTGDAVKNGDASDNLSLFIDQVTAEYGGGEEEEEE